MLSLFAIYALLAAPSKPPAPSVTLPDFYTGLCYVQYFGYMYRCRDAGDNRAECEAAALLALKACLKIAPLFADDVDDFDSTDALLEYEIVKFFSEEF